MVGHRFVFEPKIRVLHRPFDAAVPHHAKEVGKTKVLAAYTPLVVETGFVSGDQAAAIFHEGAELLALRVTQRRDVW